MNPDDKPYKMEQKIWPYTIALFFAHVLLFWLFYYAPIDIPVQVNVGDTVMNWHGLFIWLSMIVTLVLFQKDALRRMPSTSVLRLTIWSSLINWLAELLFQAVRIPSLHSHTPSEKLHTFLVAAIGMAVFGLACSFLIALQLKTKKTSWVVGLAFVFIALLAGIRALFPTLWVILSAN